jgi:hypothetical protein
MSSLLGSRAAVRESGFADLLGVKTPNKSLQQTGRPLRFFVT